MYTRTRIYIYTRTHSHIYIHMPTCTHYTFHMCLQHILAFDTFTIELKYLAFYGTQSDTTFTGILKLDLFCFYYRWSTSAFPTLTGLTPCSHLPWLLEPSLTVLPVIRSKEVSAACKSLPMHSIQLKFSTRVIALMLLLTEHSLV